MTFVGMILAFVFAICVLTAIRAIVEKNNNFFWASTFGVAASSAGLFWFAVLFWAK